MLKILTILTLIYFLNSTALPESKNNLDENREYDDVYQKPLPLQLAEAASRDYYEAGGKQVKPCSRRKSKEPSDIADQELLPTPTYSARVIKPYKDKSKNDFEPQSLRNVPEDANKDKSTEFAKGKKTKVDNDDDLGVVNVEAHSGDVSLESNEVQNKAYYNELNKSNNDVTNSNSNSNEQDSSDYVARNANIHSDESDLSNYEDKKPIFYGTQLSGEYHKDKTYNRGDKFIGEKHKVQNPDAYSDKNDKLNSANYDTKYLQDYSKEQHGAQSKSFDKFLTMAHRDVKEASDNSEELDPMTKNTKAQSDEQSAEESGELITRSHSNDYKKSNHNPDHVLYYKPNKGLYYRPNGYKAESDKRNTAGHKQANSEPNSKANKQIYKYSHEIEDAIFEVNRNRADSDELNDALYEIRKHLAHSEELKNALKEVGKKGKTYSNVLYDALFKVNKHKAESEEVNNRKGDMSDEDSDSSDVSQLYESKLKTYSNEKYESSKTDQERNHSPLTKFESKHDKSYNPGYKGSKYQSQSKDSSEDDQKCPSKQQNLVAKQLEVSRRLLSNSQESEASESSSSEDDVSQKDTEQKSQAKKYYGDIGNSETAEEKEGKEDKSESYNSNEAVAENKQEAKKSDANDDSQSAEDKEGEEDENEKTGYSYPLANPAQGPGVSEMPATGLNLMDHRRVCYACSSEFTSTCYKPDRFTTVKYCPQGHENCITKTYTNSEGRQVVIRNCADSCSVGNSGTESIWNSCDVCTSDLCNDKKYSPNGAFSVNKQSLVFTILMVIAFKFTF